MRRVILITLMCLASVSWCVGQSLGARRRSVSKSDYAGKLATLREFVARYGDESVNTFYIAKAGDDDGRRYLYAYWKEDNSILILEHFTPSGGDGFYDWLHRKARVNLATDVVPTKAEIGGSSFLTDRAWVDRIIRACRSTGERLVIRKNRGNGTRRT